MRRFTANIAPRGQVPETRKFASFEPHMSRNPQCSARTIDAHSAIFPPNLTEVSRARSANPHAEVVHDLTAPVHEAAAVESRKAPSVLISWRVPGTWGQISILRRCTKLGQSFAASNRAAPGLPRRTERRGQISTIDLASSTDGLRRDRESRSDPCGADRDPRGAGRRYRRRRGHRFFPRQVGITPKDRVTAHPLNLMGRRR